MGMEDLESQLNDTADSVQDVSTETQTQDNQAENIEQETQKPKTLHDVLNASDNQEEIQELWKQSNQFKQGLWKTPDDIMNSVQYYEKRYQPLEQTIKRMGFNEPSELEQAFKDYQSKLPEYRENEATINQLNALLQNDVYGSKLRNVFDEIRRAQETEKFGMAFDDLPPVIKERVVKGEQAFQQLEEMKQEQAYNNALGTIQEQLQQIEQIVNETGLDFDQKAFLEYCRDNNISPQNMKGEFLSAYYTQMLDKAKQSASLATTAQNKQNKTKALNSSTKIGVSNVQKSPKDTYELRKALMAD